MARTKLTPNPNQTQTELMGSANNKLLYEGMSQIASLDTKVSVLQRDVDQFNKYFEKIDRTVEKLDTVTDKMSKILILHEERNEVRNREDIVVKQNIKEIREELDTFQKDIKIVIDNETADAKKEVAVMTKAIEKRMLKIEIWKGIIMGGALTAFFFVSLYLQNRGIILPH